MLEQFVVDFPRDRKMIATLRRGSDDDVTTLLLVKVGFGLRRIEVVEVGMFDDSPSLVHLRTLLARLQLKVPLVLWVIPVLVVSHPAVLAGTLPGNLYRLNVLAESRVCAEQVSLEYACETLTDPSPPIEHSPAFDCA